MSTEQATNKINNDKLCGLCNEKTSKYCCPRCEILYCSVDCYKSENHVECSETFYRDCITEELSSLQADNESKQRMIDILQKIKEEDMDTEHLEQIIDNIDSDDENEVDLHDRVQGMSLEDSDTIWNALTQDEKNEFQAILSQGDAASIMPQWEPWWMYRRDKKLVENVDEEKKDEEAFQKCPKLKSVPEMGQLMKAEPSPAIKFNITNVLASYAFVMRYFNGELDPKEMTLYMLDICDNLKSNSNFDNATVAVESVTQKCAQSEYIETDTTNIDVMKYDTFLLLQGPSEENTTFYTKSALSHLHSILTQAKNQEKTAKNEEKSKKGEFSQKFPDQNVGSLKEIDLNLVKKSIKKIEFYLSYAEAVGMDFV